MNYNYGFFLNLQVQWSCKASCRWLLDFTTTCRLLAGPLQAGVKVQNYIYINIYIYTVYIQGVSKVTPDFDMKKRHGQYGHNVERRHLVGSSHLYP